MTQPRPRSRRRRAVFVLVAFVVLWGAAELLALLAFPLLTGQGFAPARLRAERAAAARGAAVADPALARVNATNWTLHPYLGYVLDPEDESVSRGGDGLPPVSEWGFADDGPPFRQRGPHELVVGITGGSVAAMFGDEGTAELARALRAQPGLEDLRIEFVRLAVAGYRQPQQLIAVELALAQGGAFDAVVDLGGLNELAEPVLKGATNGIHPLFPSNWQFLAADTLDPAVVAAVGGARVAAGVRGDVAAWFDASWLSWSVLANLGWKAVDRHLERTVAGYRAELQTARDPNARYVVTGPRLELGSVEARLDYGADVWARCARLLHEVCAARGIRSFHFLQPNQYVPDAKPLSDDERRAAWHADHPSRQLAEQGFPKLRTRGLELAADGVAFHDLTGVFADVRETLYVDPCCHLNRRGNELLARAIARIVGPVLAEGRPRLRADDVVALRVETPRLELGAPFARARVRVAGTLADGRVRDVSYACRDFASSAPEVATVDGYGEVEARREGEAEITAKLGERTVRATVEVRFPPQVRLDNRSPRDDDPALRAAVADGRIDVWLEPAPPPDLSAGWLLVGTEPYRAAFCRELLFAEAGKAAMLDLTRGPDGVRWSVPVTAAMRGRTVYLQAGIADPAQPCRLRTTHGLALTLR